METKSRWERNRWQLRVLPTRKRGRRKFLLKGEPTLGIVAES
jgi:hypothetical protein